MIFILTTAGQLALNASLPAPLVISQYQLADGFNYVPAVGQAALTGATQYTGTPSEPIVINNNMVKYVVSLDPNIGDFFFGEVGLYLPGNVLAAIGVADALVSKFQTSGALIGNTIAVDCYLSTVATNYAIFAELGNSNYPMNLQAIPGVDSLPQAPLAFPNIYMTSSPDAANSILAFSNNAIWSLMGYEEVVSTNTVAAATGLSVSAVLDITAPTYSGELVLQFTSGVNLGVCRTITGYNTVGQVISLATSLTALPTINDTFQVLKKTQLRPYISAILNGLSLTLTAGMINSLELIPLNTLVKQDGTTPMLAPFDSGGYRVKNVATPVLTTDATTKDYVDTALSAISGATAALSASVAAVVSTYFKKDGSLPMTGAFQGGGYRLTNVGAPTSTTDAATKLYVDTLITALAATVVTSHNALLGLQGGAPGEYYHLSLAEHTFLTNLAGTGYPTASYSTAGITQFATAAEVGVGVLNSKAITPDSFLTAMAAVGPTAMQTAILSMIAANSSSVQFGAGVPTGATPITPPFYVDTTTATRTIYVYQAATWNALNPDSSTTVSGILRLGTTAEVNAGLLTTVGVSPATLKGYLGTVPQGISVTAPQFATVAQGNVVRWSAGNFTTAIASGSAPANSAVGIADLVNLTLVTRGVLSGFTGLTVDATYWLSDLTPGAITTTQPTDAVKIGIAKSATELFIDIDPSGSGVVASGDSLKSLINQTGHGFSVGNALYLNSGVYTLARSDVSATSESVGVVSSVTDANNFELTTAGKISGLTGLVAGTPYYLSSTTAGALQTTLPTTIIKPVLVADTTTSGYVLMTKGYAAGGSWGEPEAYFFGQF